MKKQRYASLGLPHAHIEFLIISHLYTNNNWVHNCVDFCMNNVFHVHMYIQFILSRIGLLAFLVPLVIFLRCVTYIYTLCYIQAIQQFKLAHCKVSLHLNSWSNILSISTQNLVCCCCCFFFFCISLDLVIQHLKFSSAHTQIYRQHDYSCTCIFLLSRSSNYKLYKFCHACNFIIKLITATR